MYCPNCKQSFDGKFCPECGTKLIEEPSAGDFGGLHLGDANAISGGINLHDSHDVQNVDNSVQNTNIVTTDNSTNTHIVYEAQKSGEQLHAESIKTFVSEVMRFMDSPEKTTANEMLNTDSLHRLTLLSMQLMIPKHEADRIIATAQQSKMQALQVQQLQEAAAMQEQMAQQMKTMAPPMPEMPSMPQFNPQDVQLAQMQGFNPLQAAQQMGIGINNK